MAIRRRRKLYAAGLRPVLPPMVPAVKVAEHLASLRAAGVSHRDVARRIGRSYSAVRRYAYLRTGMVRWESVEGILAIRVPSAPARGAAGYVSAVGTMRRLRALAVMGWSLELQAQRMGVCVTALSRVRTGRVTSVRSSTAGTVAHWYRLMAVVPPTRAQRSEQAARMAAARGWFGPVAWDGVDIDDVDAVPEVGSVGRGAA